MCGTHFTIALHISSNQGAYFFDPVHPVFNLCDCVICFIYDKVRNIGQFKLPSEEKIIS